MRDNNDQENIRYVIKIRSRGAGKIAAIKEAIERGDLVVCSRCHSWCWAEKGSTDNICPRCKEVSEDDKR